MEPERWHQIERIHNSAVELKPGDRDAFLEKACAGDDELRKEVDRLLACKTEAEDFIESPALEVAARAMAGDSAGGDFMEQPALEFDAKALAKDHGPVRQSLCPAVPSRITKSWKSSAKEEWASSIKRVTHGLGAPWRSKSCRRALHPIPSAGGASSTKPAPPPP